MGFCEDEKKRLVDGKYAIESDGGQWKCVGMITFLHSFVKAGLAARAPTEKRGKQGKEEGEGGGFWGGGGW